MYCFHADDGRILTPPQELEPRLKDSFPAFSKLIGHIRFFYVADEIWDGESSLVFKAGGESLAVITLGSGIFNINIGEENFTIINEDSLPRAYEKLKASASPSWHRPAEQLTIPLNDPNQFPCGRRCDLCLGSQKNKNFGYKNWVCYHECVPNVEVERWDGEFNCPGCAETRNTEDCKYYPCSVKKGCANCAECGEYNSCEAYSDCHYPGQCNLGITAEEVTELVIPYASKERFDVLRNRKNNTSNRVYRI